MRNGTHSTDSFDEAIRYYHNARELLARYYGDLNFVPAAKGAMETARRVIETLSHRKFN